jgi:hypothetical protein
VNVAVPGCRHWNVAVTVLPTDAVSLSSGIVTVEPDTTGISPLLGLTDAPVRNVPIDGLPVSVAAPGGESSVHMAETTVVWFRPTKYALRLGAEPTDASDDCRDIEISTTPNAKIARSGKNFRYLGSEFTRSPPDSFSALLASSAGRGAGAKWIDVTMS